ncbi:PREDICTED: uncharacterized protein LOC107163177 [Diuraphis noxia]|uniref:uncharacterized protein LOC107163177 n=1 Tax=Diuraphis noxia TaxID=143948 RepID=UPI000763749D|nr:PREDICTED: uncharacterized protein LOC107163177 [Diuraphis noxia]
MTDSNAVVTIMASLICLSIVVRIVCGNDKTMIAFGPMPTKQQQTVGNFSGNLMRSPRFVVVNGDDVPDYDGVDDDDDHVVYDYDDGGGSGGDHDHGYGGDHDYHNIGHDDDDDDDDFDYGSGPGYHHHVWWHHYYHHGEPHLPFPLFPPIFVVHRRPPHRRCDRWPFVCRSTYEMIQWLQCYHEFLSASGIHDENSFHGVVGEPTHAWRK